MICDADRCLMVGWSTVANEYRGQNIIVMWTNAIILERWSPSIYFMRNNTRPQCEAYVTARHAGIHGKGFVWKFALMVI